ncbi:MAG: type II toxin-antitoxin system VapC family toxin [Salaquimonas sp.]|nr:type II toxin-antitoxin system VapC family toxin [Salaquimonas sp.]
MLLADTSVWVDHLRNGDEELAKRLRANEVLIHPFIIGELALGQLRNREAVLDALKGLDQVKTADHDEVMIFIELQGLYGLGVGYVDAHLLAGTKLTSGAMLWTRDRRLRQAAARLEIAAGIG